MACGGGGNPDVAALREERIAHLGDELGEDQITEVRRSQTESGTALGKPVRAKLLVIYAVEGDPAATLDAAARYAEEDGYAIDAPTQTSQGVVVQGNKDVDGRRIQLGLTLFGPENADASGVDGHALSTSLTVADEQP